jgi:hypothetical protein
MVPINHPFIDGFSIDGNLQIISPGFGDYPNLSEQRL